jgi:chemotaxis protein MotB
MKLKGRTGGSKIWIIIYADWITSLTLFFILLFYTAMVGAQRHLTREQMNELAETISNAANRKVDAGNSKAETLNNDLKNTKVSDGKMLHEYGEVTSDRNEMRITLPETVMFECGKAQLKESALPVVAAAVGALAAKYPGKIIIEGHTCDLPIHQPVPPGVPRWELAQSRSKGLGPYTSNWELSAARSLQVITYLKNEKLVPPERLIAVACGPSEPVFPNDTEEHRARNRRIVVKVELDHGKK